MLRELKFILLFFLTLSGCGKSASELSEKEKELIVNEIKTTLDNYYADIRKDGLTAEFKYLDHTTDFYWAPPGFSSPISYKEVEKALTQNAATYSEVDNKWLSLRVDPLTHHLASYTGRIQSTMTDTAGTISQYRLIETGLMIKRNHQWKLLSGQTSVVE